MRQPNVNKKRLTNKEIDNEINNIVDNKVDKKDHFEQSGLKQEIKSSYA